MGSKSRPTDRRAGCSPSTSGGDIDEGDGTLQVAVYRNYYTTGAVSVTVTPRSGTATAGDDFTADAVTLSWNDGEGGAEVIEIPINDDSSRGAGRAIHARVVRRDRRRLIGPFSTITTPFRTMTHRNRWQSVEAGAVVESGSSRCCCSASRAHCDCDETGRRSARQPEINERTNAVGTMRSDS